MKSGVNTIIKKMSAIEKRIDMDLLDRSVPGIAIYALLWPIIFAPVGFHHEQPVISWGFAIALACVSFFRLLHRFWTGKLYAFSSRYWRGIFALLSLSQALLWGGLFALSVINPAMQPVKILVMLAIGGMSSGAMIALTPRFWIAVSNVCLVFAPGILAALYFQQSYSIAILGVIYCAYLILLGKRAHAEYMRAFQIEHQLEIQRKELERLNKIDPLTQIYNRGHFNTAFEFQWNSGIRREHAQSLLLIDIDHFKAVNDNYGHLFGDNCLRHVAEIIHCTAKRKTDLVARFGGEEFTVLLSDTSIKEAHSMAEVIRTQIENSPIKYKDTEVKITASIGVSCLIPHININPDQLINMADKALYQAKDSGRNRVCQSDLTPSISG